MGRVTYVRPQINTNFAFLTVPFYAIAVGNGVFLWSFLAYIFTILFSIVLVRLTFFDVPLMFILVVNLLVMYVALFLFSFKFFFISFLRFLLVYAVSMAGFLFNCCAMLFFN